MKMRQSQAWHTEGEGLNLCRWDGYASTPHTTFTGQKLTKRGGAIYPKPQSQQGHSQGRQRGTLWFSGPSTVHLASSGARACACGLGGNGSSTSPHRDKPQVYPSALLSAPRGAMILLLVDNHLCVWEKGR